MDGLDNVLSVIVNSDKDALISKAGDLGGRHNVLTQDILALVDGINDLSEYIILDFRIDLDMHNVCDTVSLEFKTVLQYFKL